MSRLYQHHAAEVWSPFINALAIWCAFFTPVLWPPHVKSWLIGRDSDAGRDWRQDEKGTTEDDMAGWHHRLDGHEFEWTLGDGDGQGGLAFCDLWGHKESDLTEWLNWTECIYMEFRKMEMITLYVRQQKRHRCIEQSFGLCGRGQGWDGLGEWHWNMYIIICETNRQSRFDAWYRVLGAGALGWPRGMERGGRWEGGSGWRTRVHPWRIHVNVWQNQYNIVK